MSYIGLLNNSKILGGIAMILMNLGGRYATLYRQQGLDIK